MVKMKAESSVNYLNHFIRMPEILKYINILWIKTIYVLKYLKMLFMYVLNEIQITGNS